MSPLTARRSGAWQLGRGVPQGRWARLPALVLALMLTLILTGCAGWWPAPTPRPGPGEQAPGTPPDADSPPWAASPGAPGVATLWQPASRWVAADWSELPGFEQDAMHEAWNAWLRSCERPGPAFAPLCPEVRGLSIADAQTQRDWVRSRLQPYRVLPLGPQATDGLLTAYFEPELQARRLPDAVFDIPLYRPPAGLTAAQPWFSRREIDTLPAAREALRDRALVYLADPVEAMLLHIQGSGRVRVTEPDGSQRWVRLAYAANNGHGYQSIGRWLLDQGELRDASWPGIRAWVAQNPQRVQELLWQNPRVVFFREEALSALDAGFGPRGAQGVALTPGRSIAVDPGSIPYGTPVWLASPGPALALQRLVLAQDTGSAITGAVRADYFAGWGAAAGELAGRLKQPLSLWALWPR